MAAVLQSQHSILRLHQRPYRDNKATGIYELSSYNTLCSNTLVCVALNVVRIYLSTLDLLHSQEAGFHLEYKILLGFRTVEAEQLPFYALG